ncbi:LCP family protein [Nocardia sp. NPDC046763]|uniref:LCP family protein n=1 Tax=Nocardia sp. NPDC046763 TaxID=3155256 RepID=UPI00340EE108
MTQAWERWWRRPDAADGDAVSSRRSARRLRAHQPPTRRTVRLLVVARTIVALLAIFVVAGTAMAWRSYHQILGGVTTSDALADDPKSNGTDQNILIMGLDSRLDEHGNPLPQAMYDALHAGDDSVGGYNANVLILVHIPGDGSRATAISIPRDDYVNLDSAACDSSPCKAKIKQAYGFAYQRAKDKLTKSGAEDSPDLEKKSRDAGRKAEIATVRSFLGGVPVDHFVEVTLVAFFQIAQVVQPITVCLNENTSDSFSGADFHKGTQQIDAGQAMSFVRQRRDPDPSLNFTDLDRTRRQQAFIVSLARTLQASGTLTTPSSLRGVLDVAQQNIAVDNELDLPQFARQASTLVADGMSLFTLPVKDFGTNALGEDINVVDTTEIRGIVASLLAPLTSHTTAATAAATTDPTIPAASGVVLNVVNSTGRTGLAARVELALSARGFIRGAATTGPIHTASSIAYGPGADAAATALGQRLGLTATKSAALDAETVELTIGTDAATGEPITSLAPDLPGQTTSATPPVPVPATATGTQAPSPTDLSSMDSTAVPCVK